MGDPKVNFTFVSLPLCEAQQHEDRNRNGFPRTYETRGFTLVSRIGEEAHSTRRLLEIGNSSGRLFPVLCGTCFTAASGPTRSR